MSVCVHADVSVCGGRGAGKREDVFYTFVLAELGC